MCQRTSWYTNNEYAFWSTFSVSEWFSLFSSAITAIFRVPVLDKTTILSGSKPSFSPLEESSDTPAHSTHHNVSTEFSVSRDFECFHYTASTSPFLALAYFSDLSLPCENKWWYFKAFNKKLRAAFLHMLLLSHKFCFCFRFSIARFKKTLIASVACLHWNIHSDKVPV